jgi:hypothetical protein
MSASGESPAAPDPASRSMFAMKTRIAVLTQQGRRALLAATGASERTQRKTVGASGLKAWTALENSLARLVSAALET